MPTWLISNCCIHLRLQGFSNLSKFLNLEVIHRICSVSWAPSSLLFRVPWLQWHQECLILLVLLLALSYQPSSMGASQSQPSFQAFSTTGNKGPVQNSVTEQSLGWNPDTGASNHVTPQEQTI